MDITKQARVLWVFRLLGASVTAFGIYLIYCASLVSHDLFSLLAKREWTAFFSGFIIAIILGALGVFLVYAGWRNIRRPETANPRILIQVAFIFIFAVAFGLAQEYLWHDRKTPEKLLAPWEALFVFGLLLLCSLLYYGTCRRVRRWSAWTEAQRRALARPPSTQWFGFMGLMLWIALTKFNVLWMPHPPYGWALVPLAELAAVYLLYKIAYRAACKWLDTREPAS